MLPSSSRVSRIASTPLFFRDPAINFGVSVQEDELVSWGFAGIPPDAKLSSSQRLLMSLQRSGYLTAFRDARITSVFQFSLQHRLCRWAVRYDHCH